MDTRNKIFIVVGTVAVLGTAGVVGALLFTQKDSTSGSTTAATASQSSASSTSTSTSSSSSASYKDGTYTTTTNYETPHSDTNSLKVTVTIASGKITAVTTDDTYNDHDSAEYINSFEGSVKGVIVGQELGSTSQSRIGGASLTSQAFYDALDTIATQAKA